MLLSDRYAIELPDMTVLQSAPTWVRMAAALVRRLPAGRYRCANWFGRRCASPFRAQMPEQLGRLWFTCDLRDSIAREVCFAGCYEPQETAAIQALLRPGMTYVDVGANWGYFTLIGAHLVGPTGRVLGLEPDPRLHRLISANLRMNQLDHALVLPIAASNEATELNLVGYDECDGNWGLSRVAPANECHGNQFKVAAQQLDRILDDQGIPEVDLLKIDIEGAELAALQGMSDGLRQRRYKRILLEVHPAFLAEQGHTFEDVVSMIREYGYRGWRLDHSPAATRKAAYSVHCKLSDYITPLDNDAVPDTWPHLLWLKPGLELNDTARD